MRSGSMRNAAASDPRWKYALPRMRTRSRHVNAADLELLPLRLVQQPAHHGLHGGGRQQHPVERLQPPVAAQARRTAARDQEI